jgi:molecular chaperone GrpE
MVKRETKNETEQAARDEAVRPEELAAAGPVDMSPDRAGLDPQDGAAEVEGDELSELKRALEETRGELDRHREAMLRMQADLENQRKRMEREAEKSRKFALEGMMKDLLQVRDSLERGLEVGEEAATVEKLREGKALTLKVLSKVLQDHGLEVIDPEGQPFNPELHEAMTMAPSSEHEENTVLEVLQKGFRLHDRLIRPAMVVVSRKP